MATLGGARSRLAYDARAQEALLEGKPELARDILRQLLEAYPQDLEARLELAEACGQLGDLEAAIATLREVVRLDPNHPRAWFLLGKYTIQKGDPKRAIDEPLVHALVVQNRLGSEQGKADVWNAMGVAYQQLGDLERAADSYRQAAAVRQRIGDQRGYATSLKNLATLALARGSYADAERDLERALGLLRQIGDTAGIAELYNAFGGLEEERGRYDRALDAYRHALQLRRDLGDRLTLAQSLNNVGYAYLLLGEYDNAMVYWQQALALHQAAGDREGMVEATQSIGQLQLVQGKWEAALKSFLGTLGESRQLGNKAAVAVSLGNLGRVAQLEGRYPAALASYGEALALVRELGDSRCETEFTLFEAETLGELGMQPAAEALLAPLGKRAAPEVNSEQLADLQSLRGEWSLRRGDLAAAQASFARADGLAAASHSVVARLRARLGEALAAAGGRRGELTRLRAAVADVERLGHLPILLRACEGLAGAELAGGQPAAAEQAARRSLGLAAAAGPYAGAYRLHLLLAKALAARDDSAQAAEAAAEKQRAAQELQRLRRDLTPEQRAAFETLAEVKEIGQYSHPAAGAH
ncbi:MAG TPA: tetratricopeptide repeat protein [Thermoanaerobaculia bacterium]|nr:tetratricopeptide repeat protein [Thermoanaerobaculia bacterium]